MGEFVRLWASVGFDEINWSYTTRGARLLRTLGQIDETPYLVASQIECKSFRTQAPHW